MTVFKCSLLLLLLFNICRSDEVNVTVYLEIEETPSNSPVVCETDFNTTQSALMNKIKYEGIILRIPDEHRHLLPSTEIVCTVKSEEVFDMGSLITEVEGSFQVKWVGAVQVDAQNYIPDHPLCVANGSPISVEEPNISFQVEYEYERDDGIPVPVVEAFRKITVLYCMDIGGLKDS